MLRTILPLLMLGIAAPALAQTPPDGGPMGGRGPGGMLARADANGDGIVTREEALAAADARFDRLDANHDGTVTPEERRQARDAMRRGDAPPPPPADATRPAPPPAPAMTREDSRGRAMEMFARADANGDGRVDASELARLRPMRGPGPRGDAPPPPPQG